MDAATAAAIATIIGALAAVIRWLLQVWHKQQAEIEQMKESVINRTLKELESAVDDHKKSLRQTTHEIKELQTQMTRVAAVGIKVEEKWTVVSSRLEDYIQQNHDRVDKLQSELVEITKQLHILKTKGASDANKKAGN